MLKKRVTLKDIARVTGVHVSTVSRALDPAEHKIITEEVVNRVRAAAKGVTGTLRATLSDGTITHDASIQTIDQSMREFRSNRGTELNFVDSWRYNVAAYRLDRLLDPAQRRLARIARRRRDHG